MKESNRRARKIIIIAFTVMVLGILLGAAVWRNQKLNEELDKLRDGLMEESSKAVQ